MNQRKRQPLPEISEFAAQCETIHFVSYKDDSYSKFIEREKKRQEFFRIAQAGGFQYMQVFIIITSKDVQDEIDKSYAAGYRAGLTNASKSYEPRIATGDAEFDKFRKTLFNYDIYWQYSDDIDVSRRGMETDRYIDECLKKGGIYKIFHEHWKEQNKKKQ